MMVGRDGLRKVAQRQGMRIDSDVIHENDEFKIERRSDGMRLVSHSYGHPKERGPIVGAWCEVRAARPDQAYTFATGDMLQMQQGFFVAPLTEYMPRNASEYSPWTKQVSVMIMAAAERQALRQATPLSGLLAEGEDESAVAQLTAGEGTGEPVGWKDISDEQVAQLEDLLRRAEARGHAGFAHRPTVEMIVNGQTERFIADWISLADEQLAEMKVTPARAEEVADVLADVAETPAEATLAEDLERRRSELLGEIGGTSHLEGRANDEHHDALRAELADVEARLTEQIPGQESLDAELDAQAAEEAER
jgi:hypothetical protein